MFCIAVFIMHGVNDAHKIVGKVNTHVNIVIVDVILIHILEWCCQEFGNHTVWQFFVTVLSCSI